MTIFFGSVVASLCLSLFSFFFISSIFLESLIGLAVGILYVVIDTQMIIYKTENGEYDTFGDAKELFVDFIKILFEIIKILSSLSKEKKKDE
jgi:FtsH-binding integral membrane protein